MKCLLLLAAFAALALTSQANPVVELEERSLDPKAALQAAGKAIKAAGKWTWKHTPTYEEVKAAAKAVGGAGWQALEACDKNSICNAAAKGLVAVALAHLG